jgi:hypothetical protein
MSQSSIQLDVRIPTRVIIEFHAGDPDARDIIVEMEDHAIYTAVFVTMEHLQHQMALTFDLTQQIPETVPTRFAVLEIPHVIVEDLNRETIEDTIDNLLTMETFKTVFTRVTEDESAETTTTTGRLATQELAAVVLSDVIVVES